MNVLIRGGGDLASGVAVRLHRTGMNVVISELEQPLAVRRTVSFSEAVYNGECIVEGIRARKAISPEEISDFLGEGVIPVLIAPELDSVKFDYSIIVDSRLIKTPVNYPLNDNKLIIGLGPGFSAGVNCHAVVETNRGHMLGRVYWEGSAQADTARPEGDPRRVLRSPADGNISVLKDIGQHVEANQPVAEVAGQKVFSPFSGVIRGMIHPGLPVHKGMKIGDVDPRDDPAFCRLVSDKALAVAGGVLEAILTPRR